MCESLLCISLGNEQDFAMRPPEMALFGMVWLLRVRSEMKRCAKCSRRQQQQELLQAEERTFVPTFFTIDTPGPLHNIENAETSPGTVLAPTTYCEVHGYNPPKEGKVITGRIHSRFNLLGSFQNKICTV